MCRRTRKWLDCNFANKMATSTEQKSSHGTVPNLDRNSWFLEHPKLKEMQTWGFQDKVQIQTTLLVYLDLCEAKNWWHVNIHPCAELQMAYITGKPNKKGSFQTVLPITTQTYLSMARLQDYLQHIPLPPGKSSSEDDTTQNIVTLAIADSDSTIVYYRIASGLLSPELETEVSKEEKQNKRKRKKKKVEDDSQACATKEEMTEVVCEEEKVNPFQEEEL